MNGGAFCHDQVILAEHIAAISASQTANIQESVRQMLQRVTLDAADLCSARNMTTFRQSSHASITETRRRLVMGHGSRCKMSLINGQRYTERISTILSRGPCPRIVRDRADNSGNAEREDISPDTFMKSICSAQNDLRLALVAPTAVHRQGFHPTAILGAFASLSIGRIWAESKQTASALGIWFHGLWYH